jgi:GTP cyclohydrolase IA
VDTDRDRYVAISNRSPEDKPDMDLQGAVTIILDHLGYDTNDQHFSRTPERVAKWLTGFVANGDDATGRKLLEAVFDDEHDSMVVVGPTKVVSMCAHHMLPVTGWAYVGYIPDGKVVGLSKLSRIGRHYARQFTVQERVTQQVANLLMSELAPLGVMVVIEAAHGCMTLRGVEEPCAATVTSAVRGVFKEDPSAKEEFMRNIAPHRRAV